MLQNSYDEIVLQKMGMKYQFISEALNNQKVKMNLSIISESENENNKSYSKLDTPGNIVSSSFDKLTFRLRGNLKC